MGERLLGDEICLRISGFFEFCFGKNFFVCGNGEVFLIWFFYELVCEFNCCVYNF